MPPAPESPQLGTSQRIDAACDQFKANWRTGRQPRIEDCLTGDPANRDSLFRALLAAELELRAKAGESLNTATYKTRFPDRAADVIIVFREVADRRKAGTGETSVARESIRSDLPRPAGVVVETGPGRLGRFELVELLGEGAFGQVYRARDPNLDREVAIKVPRDTIVAPADRERFLREAKAAATIHHPNICPIFEAGQEGDRMYIVMALIAGRSLSAMLKERKGPLPEKQAILVTRKLALALDAAHAKGVVHRDLKPANVMMDRDRKDVVVMDFGLARRTAAGDAELTGSGMILGTPAYMAPEQARGDSKAVGPAADIYALGIMLYEMLTGQRPFRGGVGEVIGQILHVEPEPPSKLRPEVNPRLAAICMKAIAKDPAGRFASMRDFATALADCTRGASAEATPDESAGSPNVFAALVEAPTKALTNQKAPATTAVTKQFHGA
jgi:serine/threonine protein kinase